VNGKRSSGIGKRKTTEKRKPGKKEKENISAKRPLPRTISGSKKKKGNGSYNKETKAGSPTQKWVCFGMWALAALEKLAEKRGTCNFGRKVKRQNRCSRGCKLKGVDGTSQEGVWG